ncbi:MAG: hypothetical protein DRQ89_14435 [Epsilonproteobacteria bacterium]|nr:MAG: hypothetical protein DRQ89_14435 [Campylobacterota bacterium]
MKTIDVRIAVGISDEGGIIEACAISGTDYRKTMSEEEWAWVIVSDGMCNELSEGESWSKHIITASIPLSQVPEVEGTVEG